MLTFENQSPAILDDHDMEVLREQLLSRLWATGEVRVINRAHVDQTLRLRQQRSPCDPSTLRCQAIAAQEMGGQILVQVRVSAYGAPGSFNVGIHLVLADVRRIGRNKNVFINRFETSRYAAFAYALEEVTDAVVEYASIDPEKRWRRPPMDTDRMWAGLRASYIPVGGGKVRVERGDAAQEATYSDDTFYGLNFHMNYLFEHIAFGGSLWWYPSFELELDDAARRSLGLVAPRFERSVVGEADESADVLDFNASLELTESYAHITGNYHLTELILYANAEGGYSVGVSDDDRDELELPTGYNYGAGAGIIGMVDHGQGWRFGAQYQRLVLEQALRPVGGVDTSARIDGWRVLVTLGLYGG